MLLPPIRLVKYAKTGDSLFTPMRHMRPFFERRGHFTDGFFEEHFPQFLCLTK